MKKLLSAALIALLLPAFAEGANYSTPQIRSLIAVVKQRTQKLRKDMRAFSDPLIRFSASPGTSPEQGQEVTLFATLNSGFTNSETFLAETKLDGASVTMEHPSEGLWLFDAGSFTELGSHTFEAKVYIQEATQAKAIRDAIEVLEQEIAELNEQIEESTDPTEIAELTAARDEKQALKTELTTALAGLKTFVTTESYAFTVVPATTGSNFPKITNVAPNFGKFDEATSLTITGTNFPADSTLEVKIGGALATSATRVSATELTATTPVFTEAGSKDVEVRFTKDGKTKNAFFRNAYFAGDSAAEVEANPVAIAGANQSVNLGTEATFSAANSYDPNGHEITYAWQLISKPAGSSLTVPTNPPGTNVNFSVTPDVPGTYVLSLVVAKASPAMMSAPSLTVLEAVAPANRAPVGSAPAISTSRTLTKTSQITHSDPDTWQQRTFHLTQQSAYGTATVNSTGLVTFTAGSTAGSDTLKVTIVDNGTPPLSTVVSIPVTVIANNPPVLGTFTSQIRSQGLPVQMALFAPSTGQITDSDGSIQSVVWDFGDGTSEKTTDFSMGFLMHNYMATGTYTATITATDNQGAATSKNITVNVVNTDVPTAKMKVSPASGSVPLTITFDASDSSDADGITEYRWLWGSGVEEVTTNPVITHTFNSSGNVNVRLRTRDQYSAQGESTVTVFPGGSQPGATSIAQVLVGPPRMVTFGNALSFDGSRSFNPNPSIGLGGYNWTFADFTNCPANNCSTEGQFVNYTYPLARNYFPGLQVRNPGGFVSTRVFMEVFNVNTGLPPRAITRMTTPVMGAAPLTVSGNGLESYDYDGTITGYQWTTGDGNNYSGSSATHTYTAAGVYNFNLTVTDNDGNQVFTNTMVTVTAAPPAKKKLEGEPDPEREYLRQVLTNACGSGEGEACYQLGNMYGEDGDEVTKAGLWAHACELGYADACVVGR